MRWYLYRWLKGRWALHREHGFYSLDDLFNFVVDKQGKFENGFCAIRSISGCKPDTISPTDFIGICDCCKFVITPDTTESEVYHYEKPF